MITTLRNPGLIDLDTIRFMGVNVKEGPAIGYFGTGLKFAIAGLLREGHSITIWRGLEKLDFDARSRNIRGKDFSLIHMNGEPLGITTDLGKNWEVWMMFRELYSNMLDEKGEASSGPIAPADGWTTIQVVGQDFHDWFLKRGEIFLHGRVPIYSDDYIQIFPHQSRYAFYRGVRTSELMKPTRYTYNVLSKLDLTEDRVLARPYMWVHSVANRMRCAVNDPTIVEAVISLDPEGTLEEDSVDWDAGWDPTSELFLDSVEKTGIRCVSTSALTVWRNSKRARDLPEFEEIQLTEMSTRKLAKAKAFLTLGLGYTDEFTIKIASDLGKNVLGYASQSTKTIWISHVIFEKGTKEVASVLYEEWVHLKHGLLDNCYEMQTFLFDKILTLVETINGEPL